MMIREITGQTLNPKTTGRWIRALMIIEDERLAVLSRNCWNNGISRWKHRPDKRLEEEIVCNRW